jgi:hypothetical protein
MRYHVNIMTLIFGVFLTCMYMGAIPIPLRCTVICGGPYVDYSVMIIIGEIVSYLVLKPFFSVWQALAGILQPTHVPSLLRAKKVATVFLVAGVFGMSAGVATLLLWGALRTCLLVLLAGFISLAIASAIGHRIEQEVMQEPRK